MKKLLALTLLISCVQIAFGQFYFREEEADTAEGMYSHFDLATHFHFVNKSADTTFTWRRFDVDVPNGVTTAVCDNNLCYPVEVSTAGFNLGTNDSFEFILHFYPDDNCGKGSFKLMLFPQADTNNRIYIQVFTNIWCLNVTSIIEANTLKLYPNPTASEIEITFGSIDAYDIAIYDMGGNKVIESKGHSLIKRIDVAELRSGMYMVAVNSEGRTFTQTFIKD